MIREVDVAYLAGVVDSDGCIRVERMKNHGRSRDGLSYGAFVSIQQIEPQAVDLAKLIFGGFVQHIKPTPKRPEASVMIRWTAKSRIAAAALTALRPYLRIKTAQANNALALAALVRELHAARYDGFGPPRHRTPAELDRMAVFYEESRRLNSGELNPAYVELQKRRAAQLGMAFA